MTEDETEEWTWTVNGADWAEPLSASREAAEADAREELPLRGYYRGTPFLTGRKADVMPLMRVNMSYTLDQVGEQAYDLVEDAADGWPRTSGDEALQDALDAALRAYLERHDPPSFWAVVDVQEHRL